jgi:hypothetical protein
MEPPDNFIVAMGRIVFWRVDVMGEVYLGRGDGLGFWTLKLGASRDKKS